MVTTLRGDASSLQTLRYLHNEVRKNLSLLGIFETFKENSSYPSIPQNLLVGVVKSEEHRALLATAVLPNGVLQSCDQLTGLGTLNSGILALSG
jgi:hypothetical protein